MTDCEKAVIWEGLRMHPSVTLGVYKILPPSGGDTTLYGVRLPQGLRSVSIRLL